MYAGIEAALAGDLKNYMNLISGVAIVIYQETLYGRQISKVYAPKTIEEKTEFSLMA